MNRRGVIVLIGSALVARAAGEGPPSRLDLDWTFSGHFAGTGGV
jgi:hypothetical protein